MPSGYIEINKNEDKTFKGFITAPATGIYPGILLLHDAFGLDATIRSIAERYAAFGYTTLVPDLFWKQSPSCELNSNTESGIKEASELIENFDEESAANDISIALRWLRESPQCNGLTAPIGFGIGGKLSYLAGCWFDVEASMSYYGRGIDKALAEGNRVRRPMLLHLAENDSHTSIQAQKEIIRFFEDQKTVTVSQYKNCHNGFIDPWSKFYNRSETEIAEIKTLELINNSFKNPSTV